MDELENKSKAPATDKFLPYGHQWIDDEDIKEVVRALRSDWITQGPKIKEFEEALAKFVEAKYAVAFNSGTAALHTAFFAAGIKKGDEAITTPISFVATSNCILYSGAKPVFADITEDTHNIDPEETEKKITPTTRAIVPVDFAGRPADLEKIYQIAKEHNLIVIEDASHALGAQYRCNLQFNNWIKVGSCVHSDMTTFSFHPVKLITTGEGGAVTTNNKELYEKLLLFRTHGITKDPTKFINRNEGPWYYEMQELGHNYRITDCQCALGISQLKKLDKFIKRRREIVKRYNEAFKNIEEIVIPYEKPEVKSAWHIYVIRLKLDKLKTTRKAIFEALRAENIGVHVHYIPVYYHPYYQSLRYRKGLCPKAEKYYEEVLTLPLFPKMKNEDTERVVKRVKEIISTFAK